MDRSQPVIQVKKLPTPPQTTSHQVTIAWLLAIETAMRAGELLKLTWPDVHLDEQYVQLQETKNGTSRQVSLSSQAVLLLEILNGKPDQLTGNRVFYNNQPGVKCNFSQSENQCRY